MLDKRNLVVVHGGWREEFLGKCSNVIKNVCLYGEKTGHILENGIAERLDWVLQYKGKAFVVYGHTVTEKPIVVNHTAAIDQGCVYGGFLTALRYPEIEFIQVKGKQYAEYKGQSNVIFE